MDNDLAINKSAQDTNGQRATMAHASTGVPAKADNMGLCDTKNVVIDPNSDLGHKRFDQD